MKKIIAIAGLFLSAITFSPTSAHADGACDSVNPCGTYAVVNPAGVVTNIIVCQAIVCGGGTWAGQTVVLQVPTGPDNNAQGGYFSGQNSPNPVTYNSQTQTFTVPGPISTSVQGPTVSNSDGTISSQRFSATIQSSGTFHAPTSITDLNPIIPKSTTPVAGSVSDTQITKDTNGVVLSGITQSQTFSPGLSHDQMMYIINNNLSNYLIASNSESLIHLLFILGY